MAKSAKSNNASKPTNSPAPKPNAKSKETKKPALKEVKVADLFGKGPVHRTPIPKITKKTEDVKGKTEETKKATEIGVHNDDGFDETLIQLDDEATVSPNDKKSDQKDSPNAKKSNLKDSPTAKKCDTKESPTKQDSVLEPKAEPHLNANYKIPHKPKGSSDKNRDDDRRNEFHSSRDDDRRNRSGDRHRSDDRYGRDRSGDRHDSRHGRDNRNSDRSRDRNSDRSRDRNSDRSRDRNRDRSRDRNSNRNERSDRNSDRNDRSDRSGRDNKSNTESKRDNNRRHNNRSKDRLPTPSPVKNRCDTLKSPAKKEELIIIEDEKSYAYKKPARISRVDQKKSMSEKVHGKKDFSMFIDGDKGTDDKKKVTNDKKKIADVDSDADMNETVEYGLTSPTADSDDHNDTAKSKTRKRKNLDSSG